MIPKAYNLADKWQTKKDIATYAMSRMRILHTLEITCANYESSIDLARMIQKFDNNREVREIHIFSYFVRIIRNDDNNLRFSAQVIDHHERKTMNQNEL